MDDKQFKDVVGKVWDVIEGEDVYGENGIALLENIVTELKRVSTNYIIDNYKLEEKE